MCKKIFFLDILVLGFLSLNYLTNTYLRGNAIKQDTTIRCLCFRYNNKKNIIKKILKNTKKLGAATP